MRRPDAAPRRHLTGRNGRTRASLSRQGEPVRSAGRIFCGRILESASEPAGPLCEQVGVDRLAQKSARGAHRRTTGATVQKVGEVGDPADLDLDRRVGAEGHGVAGILTVRDHAD
ncbi:hypothetical protein M2271_006690 [Streptomyces sp. LBL]|nr:hypothetical protein [Streptomyces sp. LBL]